MNALEILRVIGVVFSLGQVAIPDDPPAQPIVIAIDFNDPVYDNTPYKEEARVNHRAE